MKRLKDSPFVVAFSGDPVSGKSSTIRALIKLYESQGYTVENEVVRDKAIIRLAAGQMFRDIALAAGLSVGELTDKAKVGSSVREISKLPNANKEFFATFSNVEQDMSIDNFIDTYMIAAIKEASEKFADCKDVIIIADSRIAGLLLKREGEDIFNIRLSVQPEIAAERLIRDARNRSNEIDISEDDELAFKEALQSVSRRNLEDRRRFIQIYSRNLRNRKENAKVDLMNLENYDLVINTSGVTVDKVAEVLMNCLERAKQDKPYNRNWRSTKYMYPGSSMLKATRNVEKITKLRVIKLDGQYFAFGGQEHLAFANKHGYDTEQETGTEEGYKLFPVELIAQDDELFFYHHENEMIGTTPREYVCNNITDELVKSFEQRHGFKYPSRGMKELPRESKVLEYKV